MDSFKDIRMFSNLSEEKFYDVINKETNFIFAAIEHKTKDKTYLDERYSSNFNQSLILNKPIICNDYFKNIYKIPGFYYNEDNYRKVFSDIFSLSQNDYCKLIDQFDFVKKEMMDHNKDVIEKKLSNL